MASASTGPAPSTPQRDSSTMGSTGLSPVAKRAATLESMMGSGVAGAPMDANNMNAFLYALHYKVEALEKWAPTVEGAITDHAIRIDKSDLQSAKHNLQFIGAKKEILSLWQAQWSVSSWVGT